MRWTLYCGGRPTPIDDLQEIFGLHMPVISSLHSPFLRHTQETITPGSDASVISQTLSQGKRHIRKSAGLMALVALYATQNGISRCIFRGTRWYTASSTAP